MKLQVKNVVAFAEVEIYYSPPEKSKGCNCNNAVSYVTYQRENYKFEEERNS